MNNIKYAQTKYFKEEHFYKVIFKLFLWLLIRDNGYEKAKAFVERQDILGELKEEDLFKRTAIDKVFSDDALGNQQFSEKAINGMLSVIQSLL